MISFNFIKKYSKTFKLYESTNQSYNIPLHSFSIKHREYLLIFHFIKAI